MITEFNEIQADPAQETVGGLTVDQLGVVHITKYRPSVEEGALIIPTTFDAKGGMDQSPEDFSFRNTVHVSLNGPVASHMQGNWDDMGYAIVSPFLNVVEQNGSPLGFDTVDTYWDFGQGEPMSLTEYSIVQPDDGRIEEGEFIRHEGQDIFCKTSFSNDEKLQFIRGFLPSTDKTRSADIREAEWERLPDDMKEARINRIKVREQSHLCESMKSYSVSCIPRDFYVESEEDLERFEGLVLSAEGEDLEKIDMLVGMRIRNEAIYQALDHYNCPRKTCGKDYWVDEGKNYGSNEFAIAVGSEYTSHAHSKQGALEAMINGSGIFSLYELADPEDIRAFMEENRGELSDKTVSAVETLIDSDLYRQAQLVRQQLLNPHALAGHNGGPRLDNL